MASEGWISKPFGECATLVRDTVLPDNSEGSRYIGLEHISQGGLTLLSYGYANQVTSIKSKFMKGDVLFGKLRPYFRKVIIAPFDGVCSTDIWVVRPGLGIDKRFLFYLMASQQFVDEATRASEGTKMPRAQWEFVSRFVRSVPPLPEQRAIAHILGSLDDKIEVNRRMNETLEGMARAIFMSWFVDFDPVRAKAAGRDTGLPKPIADLFPNSFMDSELGEIPKGWKVGTVGGVATVSSGKRPVIRSGNETEEMHIPLWGGNGPMGFVPEALVDEQILLTGRVGTLGSVFRIGSPCWPSDNTLILRATHESVLEYLFFQLRAIDFRSLNRGSTQPLLTQSDLNRQRFVLPTPEAMTRFHTIAANLLERADTCEAESTTLASLRDTLLPKLISGEIRVKDAEKFAGRSI